MSKPYTLTISKHSSLADFLVIAPRSISECVERTKFLTSHLGIRLEKVECIVIFDEVTKMPNERENYEGIVKRGLKEEWCGYIRREYEFSMAVCRSLASDFETFMKLSLIHI